jgi:hypothetical protein
VDLRPLIGQPFLDSRFPLPLDRPFTLKQARAEGVSPANLTRLTDQRLLVRTIKGVYLAAQAGDSPLLRAQSLALVVPEDCVVCDRHAGWLHGADMILRPNEHLNLRPISIFRPSGRGRLRNGLSDSGERNLTRFDVTDVSGLRVTTPLRTAWDLGRVRFREEALSGLDAMLRLGVFSHGELVAGVERFRGMRWVTRLRELAPLADGRAASPGESVLRLRWLDCGLGVPELQVEVWVNGSLLAVLDIADEGLRFAAEYDGAEWHSSDEQRDHDAERRGLVRDADWVVTPFVAANVFGMRRDCDDMLRAGVREARELRARQFTSSRP